MFFCIALHVLCYAMMLKHGSVPEKDGKQGKDRCFDAPGDEETVRSVPHHPIPQAAVTGEGPYANWSKHVADPFGKSRA